MSLSSNLLCPHILNPGKGESAESGVNIPSTVSYLISYVKFCIHTLAIELMLSDIYCYNNAVVADDPIFQLQNNRCYHLKYDTL